MWGIGYSSLVLDISTSPWESRSMYCTGKATCTTGLLIYRVKLSSSSWTGAFRNDNADNLPCMSWHDMGNIPELLCTTELRMVDEGTRSSTMLP